MAVFIEEHRSTDKGTKCQRLFRENALLVLLICFIIIGIVIGVLLLFVAPVLLKEFKKEPRPYRLPTDLVPYQYELEIKPYLTPGEFRFEGQVKIYLTCSRRTDAIVLHSKNLTLDEGSVKVSSVDDGDDFEVLQIDYNTTNDLLILRLLDDLKERRTYRIDIKFKGSLEEGYEGFYISPYKDDEEITHYVATTHFEPVGARTAFPCFDEPDFKSTFNITLVRWENMTSLSNMPRVRTEYREDGWEADIFKKSMKMSTYLVAFVFSDYIGITKGKVTVWAPKHKIDYGLFALNVSEQALQFYEDKLGIPYLGPKLDMVAVTHLEAAAMENWGLIIFEESSLLTSEDKWSIEYSDLDNIAATVAHEIAHQWFGNLVTIKWWSDIWLNEGITSYMGDLFMGELYPDWHKIDTTILTAYDFIISDCSRSVPIWQPVLNSTDANKSFLGGTYPKGAMITRMVHQILGEVVFWKGIKRYLSSYSYGNVEEADLWSHLTAAQLPGTERLDMAEIMHSWTHLSGIPIVTVHRDYSKRTATISQKSCKSDEKKYENDLWNIPIIIETKYAVNLLGKTSWLKTRSTTVGGMPDEDDWIVVNGDSTGLYIVNYDRENWNLLFDQMRKNHAIFDYTQRFKFLEEIMHLERSGDVEIDLVFDSFIYLKEERSVEILHRNMIFMNSYVKFLDEKEYQELLKEFMIYTWKDIYDIYGWNGEDDYKATGKSFLTITSYPLTKNLCAIDYEPCLERAFAQYPTLKLNRTTYDEALSINEWLVLCTVVKNATYEVWKEIKDNHFNENSDNLSFILRCSNDASVIRSELLSLSNDYSDIFYWLLYAASEYKTAFDAVLNFFDELFEKFFNKNLEISKWHRKIISDGVNFSRMQRLIQMLSKHLKYLSGSSAENLETFIEFLKEELPKFEKKTRTLKKWLKEKPWLQLI